jgi:hypothetical protein
MMVWSSAIICRYPIVCLLAAAAYYSDLKFLFFCVPKFAISFHINPASLVMVRLRSYLSGYRADTAPAGALQAFKKQTVLERLPYEDYD